MTWGQMTLAERELMLIYITLGLLVIVQVISLVLDRIDNGFKRDFHEGMYDIERAGRKTKRAMRAAVEAYRAERRDHE